MLSVSNLEDIKSLAKKYIESKQLILLTYGTNGEGGLGYEKLDKSTKKYSYIFVCVSNSCIVGDIPEVIEVFNSVIINHLDDKFGNSWRKDLSKKLTKKNLRNSIF